MVSIYYLSASDIAGIARTEKMFGSSCQKSFRAMLFILVG